MNAIVSDANERQELNGDYVNPEPAFERLRDVHDADRRSLAQEAQGLLDNLPAHRTLFHPLADLGLEPLRRVGDLADVFVLCDWRWPNSPDGFDATIGDLVDADSPHGGLELFAGEHSFEIPAEQVLAITGVSEDFGLFNEPAWKAGQQPWGRIIPLRRRGGDVEQPVWLVYITGNCVDIYQHLFVDRGAAPRVLWLDCPLSADLDGWARFISPSGEFGRVFSTVAHQPEHVVAQRYQPGWHQTVLCQRLPAWHPSWTLTLFALPGQQVGADGDGLSP